MPFQYSGNHVTLGAANSNLTGSTWFVDDFRQLSLSIHSSTASASRYTIVGSNLDGFRLALGNASPTVSNESWSHVTVVTSQGIFTIDPGFRWIAAFRDPVSVSATSNVTVIFNGRT